MDPVKNSARKDFFISYTGADEQWAEWIAWQLKEAGYSIILQKWDFHAGGNFILKMHRAAIETERTLAVLSPRYLDALFTNPEWAAVLVHDSNGAKRLLIPVRIEDFTPSGLFTALIYIDLVGLKASEGQAELLSGIRASVQGGSQPPTTEPIFPGSPVQGVINGPRFPGTLPPHWNVPYQRNPNFTGREEVLGNLQEQFKDAGQKASSRQVLYGLGGVGKSQIAAEYCYRNSAGYDVVWWLRAEDATSLAADYTELAGEKVLNLPVQTAKEQDVIINTVWNHLNHHGKWLLVFDNAKDYESIARYLPQASGGHVLITSQNQDWRQVGKPHEIIKWQRPESVKFLLKRTGYTDQEGADNIAEALDGLPLALEQAGAYIATCGIKMNEYLELFDERRRDLWQEESGPLDHKHTVEVTFGLSIENVRNAEPMAEVLLNLCSVVAPDEIPKALLKSCDLYVPDSAWKGLGDTIVMNRALRELKKYSLITTDKESISLHRLVQIVVRDHMGIEITNQCREATLKSLNELFTDGAYNNPSYWPECAKLLPHADKVITEISDENGAWIETASLLNKIGLYNHGRGLYAEAEPMYRRSLEILEKQLGPEHPDVAASLNNLALLLQDQGLYAEAESHFRQALDIREKQLGTGHPEVGNSLNNLAELLREQGKYTEAELFNRRALRILEKQLGPDHSSVATSLNNLALTLRSQGNYKEAESLNRRVLKIKVKRLGPDHIDVATILNNLAELLREQCKYTEAEKLIRRSLDIREKQLGPDHPHVSLSLNNLALLLFEQGKNAEAELHILRALWISEKQLDSDHPSVATSLNNLALLLQDQGLYAEAESHFRQALDIREKQLGPGHPEVGNSLNNLAELLREQGKYTEAELLNRRALRILEKQLGPDHPSVATSLNNLALTLCSQGNYKEAETLNRCALDIRKKQLGPDHPSVATSLNNLAFSLCSQGKYVEAESLTRCALQISEMQLGLEHPRTKLFSDNLEKLHKKILQK